MKSRPAGRRDYCTGWFEHSWWDCCRQHDADYVAPHTVTREEADDFLRE